MWVEILNILDANITIFLLLLVFRCHLSNGKCVMKYIGCNISTIQV